MWLVTREAVFTQPRLFDKNNKLKFLSFEAAVEVPKNR